MIPHAKERSPTIYIYAWRHKLVYKSNINGRKEVFSERVIRNTKNNPRKQNDLLKKYNYAYKHISKMSIPTLKSELLQHVRILCYNTNVKNV